MRGLVLSIADALIEVSKPTLRGESQSPTNIFVSQLQPRPQEFFPNNISLLLRTSAHFNTNLLSAEIFETDYTVFIIFYLFIHSLFKVDNKKSKNYNIKHRISSNKRPRRLLNF